MKNGTAGGQRCEQVVRRTALRLKPAGPEKSGVFVRTLKGEKTECAAPVSALKIFERRLEPPRRLSYFARLISQ
ncbi:hypothetical protein [Pontiella sp.]|uniref:hypothetical protein n=1 Tax=Pontiella sp. TaxID=2837462 RepID=UPI0035690DDB